MEAVLAAAVTGFFAVTVALLTRQNKRSRRVEKKVEGIDKAVNSRPPEQPSLYDLVATLDMKVDQGFTTLHRRIDQLHERVDGVADR